MLGRAIQFNPPDTGRLLGPVLSVCSGWALESRPSPEPVVLNGGAVGGYAIESTLAEADWD